MQLLSIITSCYNEETNIMLFYEEVKKITEKLKEIKIDIELIFVDDGSTDKTLKIIKKLAREDERVHYISFSRNFGKEATILAGLKYAKGEYVTLMDVDLQDPPAMLLEMFDVLLKEDYDVVGLKADGHKNYGIIRRFCTFSFYKIIGRLSSVPMTPNERDYRLMKKKVVDAVLTLSEYNRYSKGLFNFVGFKTKWLKYELPERKHGKTKWSIKKLFSYGINGIVGFSTKPLVLASLIGIIFCFIAFLAIIFIIVKTLIWKDPVSGWPSLACIIVFCSGVQLLFLGIIGEYISKIYLETKQRPIYIINETDEDEENYL